MASGLFFSSPPHPTSNPWQQTSSAAQFFTPQKPFKYNWNPAAAAAAATPTSPSPLRTSRNANLMSSPVRGGKVHNHHNYPDHPSSDPVTATTDNDDDENTFPPPSTTFFLGPPTTTTPFQFESASSSLSPSALLSSHTRRARDTRKHLFLDRLRTRRADARDARAADHVLRSDYLRERRVWEAEKSRGGGGMWNVDGDVDVDGDGNVDVEGEMEMSPVDEQGEVEDLARWYYRHYQEEAEEEGLGEFEDEGYDEAFMEFLNQEQKQGQGQQPWGGDGGGAGMVRCSGPLSVQRDGAATGAAAGGVDDAEMDMDMS